jgi:hypothetical protein
VCFYKWGDREAVRGPQACDLRIGSMLPSMASAYTRGDRTSQSVDETAGYLSVSAGVGDESVRQGFSVVKSELLEPAR